MLSSIKDSSHIVPSSYFVRESLVSNFSPRIYLHPNRITTIHSFFIIKNPFSIEKDRPISLVGWQPVHDLPARKIRYLYRVGVVKSRRKCMALGYNSLFLLQGHPVGISASIRTRSFHFRRHAMFPSDFRPYFLFLAISNLGKPPRF